MVRIPAPDESVPRWHVSPLVDAVAYHWSWALVLVPTLFMGSTLNDYLIIFLVVLGFNFSHRHLTLPYAYGDSQVFRANRWRFVVFPLLMLGLFAAAPFMWKGTAPANTWTFGALIALGPAALVGGWIYRHLVRGAPAGLSLGAFGLALGGFVVLAMGWTAALGGALVLAGALLATRFAPRVSSWAFVPLAMFALAASLLWTASWGARVPLKQVVVGLATFAALWNIWHVYMQKYGILRLYNAKSGVPPEQRAPGWSDRLLVLCWLPLYFVYLGPAQRENIHRYFRSGKSTMEPFLDAMVAVQPYTLPAAIALVVFAIAMFLRYEWRASRLRNPARLGMAVGTTTIGALFLLVDPVKCYLAFGFSHAFEYSVFVWAYQRKRYRQPLPHKPVLAHLLKAPILYYGLVLVGCATIYLGLKYWGRHFGEERVMIAGLSGSRWMFFWAVFQSMVHFYFDGFLWKMRLPSVRENV